MTSGGVFTRCALSKQPSLFLFFYSQRVFVKLVVDMDASLHIQYLLSLALNSIRRSYTLDQKSYIHY